MAALPSSLNSLHLPTLAHHRPSSPSSRSISDRSPPFYTSRVVGDRLLPFSASSTATAAAFRSSCPRMMGNLCIGKAHKWWEKGLEPNMKEITSAPHLVESLLTAGDKLVVVDFFSPGCGGCKALHPKICKLAEQNPEVLFLQVNYEEHKSMCYSLNVHVLPFFRFYRGAHGRLCSFSCTNATIKKFKDALAKHGTDRCSLGPAKGLEETELIALASNKELSFNYTPSPVLPSAQEQVTGKASLANPKVPLPSVQNSTQSSEGKALVAAGR